MMLDKLTIQDFEPHIGTGFTITTEAHVEVLTLHEVSPAKHPYPGREPFALAFTGSSNELMFESQIVLLTHPVMGDMSIMISPYGRTDEGYFKYEAVFN